MSSGPTTPDPTQSTTTTHQSTQPPSSPSQNPPPPPSTTTPTPPSCAHCALTPPTLKPCAKCHTTLYCTRDCQKAHFKTHKKACAGLAQEYVKRNEPKMARGGAPRRDGGGAGGRGIGKWEYDT